MSGAKDRFTLIEVLEIPARYNLRYSWQWRKLRYYSEYILSRMMNIKLPSLFIIFLRNVTIFVKAVLVEIRQFLAIPS